MSDTTFDGAAARLFRKLGTCSGKDVESTFYEPVGLIGSKRNASRLISKQSGSQAKESRSVSKLQDISPKEVNVMVATKGGLPPEGFFVDPTEEPYRPLANDSVVSDGIAQGWGGAN